MMWTQFYVRKGSGARTISNCIKVLSGNPSRISCQLQFESLTWPCLASLLVETIYIFATWKKALIGLLPRTTTYTGPTFHARIILCSCNFSSSTAAEKSKWNGPRNNERGIIEEKASDEPGIQMLLNQLVHVALLCEENCVVFVSNLAYDKTHHPH